MDTYNINENLKPNNPENIPGVSHDILEQHPKIGEAFENANSVLDKAKMVPHLSLDTLRKMYAIKKILALFPGYNEQASLN